MLKIEIQDYPTLKIENLVLDYNGTLALDGIPYNCVYELLKKLSKKLNIFILTADTFGNVLNYEKDLSGKVIILTHKPISEAKDNFIIDIGKDKTIAIGNGRNDEKMLKTAAIGIGLIQKEGIYINTLLNSDLIFYSICDALNALLNPKRIIASLKK